MRATILLSLLAFLLVACSSVEPIEPEQPAAQAPLIENTPAEEPLRWNCEEPRPTRCPTTTDPVCGSDAAEYRSDCYACRNVNVEWYVEGPCA